MKKIIAANWKMNPKTAQEAEDIVKYLIENFEPRDVQLIIFPPFLYFCHLRDELGKDADKFDWGAQDIFWENSGAYTGEISPSMLKSFWVEYVLVGHSERRLNLGETDEIINKKVKAALKNDIRPILLVGEKEKDDFAQDILIDQLTRGLDGISKEDLAKVIVVYEPVWAISTNKNAEADDPDNTIEKVRMIKDILVKISDEVTASKINILYGGSVNSKNIGSFLERPEIGGAVVGGASIKKEEFLEMLKIIEKL